MIQEAINCYHDLLTEQLALEMHGVLREQSRNRRLLFGDVPLCRVLRPHFYLPDQWRYLKERTELVLQAFMQAHVACVEDPALRAQLDLEPYEEEMLAVDLAAGIRAPWSSSRLDSFYNADTGYLAFVEYNAETPAGIGYGDQLTELFMEMEIMRQFQAYYRVTPFFGMPNLVEVLQRAWTDWGGQGIPQIAIADWREVPTLSEHEISRVYFEHNGNKALLCDPREMEYRNGSLWAGDFRVDMIYKRVLISELVERLGMESDMVRAVRDRAVFLTNSFSAKLMAKKASLALLSDDANAHLFTPAQRDAIAQHIPWTRRVADRKTRYQGRDIDLLEFIERNQQRLVLKPNDDYGGHGVVIGWAVSADEWTATLKKALAAPYVVQERVEIRQRDFPMVIDGHLDISPRYVDADPYVFYGETVGGCLTRLSGAALLNVTAGAGSVVPMFVVEKR